MDRWQRIKALQDHAQLSPDEQDLLAELEAEEDDDLIARAECRFLSPEEQDEDPGASAPDPAGDSSPDPTKEAQMVDLGWILDGFTIESESDDHESVPMNEPTPNPELNPGLLRHPRRQLFSQTVGEVTIRGWNDGTFDVVDDWMLPATARFDTYEAARAWADNYNSMEA